MNDKYAAMREAAQTAGIDQWQADGFEQVAGNGTFYGGLIVTTDGETVVAQCVMPHHAPHIAIANPAAVLDLLAERDSLAERCEFLAIATRDAQGFAMFYAEMVLTMKAQRDAWKTEAERQYQMYWAAKTGVEGYPVLGALDAEAATLYPALSKVPQ